MLLEVRRIAVAYGTARVLSAVSLAVDEAESVTLIGANGAGKTSCLRAVSGLVPLADGEVWFAGERIDTCRRGGASSWVWCTCRKASGCSRA